MSLRVTLATYDDAPPLGGQGVLVRGLRAALERRGVVVRTVAGRGAHAVRAPAVVRRAPLDLSIELNRHPRRLLEGGPDVIHVMGGPGGVLLLRRLPVPVVYTANHTYAQAHPRWHPKRALSALEARAYRRAARVLPISESTAEAVRRLGVDASRIDVVHPGVDVERFAAGGGSRDPLRVLFVGRLVAEKGPLEAVIVMQRLAAAHPGVSGAVVGTGGLDAEVRRAAAGSAVEVVGALDDSALALQYRRAALVVVTSRYEGLGLVALEAMAAGAVVVGFDVTGLRDAVGDRGVLVSPGDVDAMVDACSALLADPRRREELAVRAREHVRRAHSWDVVAARVEEVYRNILSPGRG